MSGSLSPPVIEPYAAVAARTGLVEGLDEVFFTSSATQSFPSDEARTAFRERWLGRYLEHFPDCALVALDREGRVAGYVVGSLDDPAQNALFDDIGYFKRLAPLTARFPAQLHVNVRADCRGAGLGAALVSRFMAKAREAGSPGIHVVTAKGMRNVGFYARTGFRAEAAFDWNGRALLFLASPLHR